MGNIQRSISGVIESAARANIVRKQDAYQKQRVKQIGENLELERQRLAQNDVRLKQVEKQQAEDARHNKALERNDRDKTKLANKMADTERYNAETDRKTENRALREQKFKEEKWYYAHPKESAKEKAAIKDTKGIVNAAATGKAVVDASSVSYNEMATVYGLTDELADDLVNRWSNHATDMNMLKDFTDGMPTQSFDDFLAGADQSSNQPSVPELDASKRDAGAAAAEKSVVSNADAMGTQKQALRTQKDAILSRASAKDVRELMTSRFGLDDTELAAWTGDELSHMQDTMKEVEARENSIVRLENGPQLMGGDESHNDSTQVFTRGKDVNTMIRESKVAVPNDDGNFKTTLDPASGDGAFNVRILQERFKAISADPKTDSYERFAERALQALGTIYGVELYDSTAANQRNNMYTAFLDMEDEWISKHGSEASESLRADVDSLARKMINLNIMTGSFNAGPDADPYYNLHRDHSMGTRQGAAHDKAGVRLSPILWRAEIKDGKLSYGGEIMHGEAPDNGGNNKNGKRKK